MWPYMKNAQILVCPSGSGTTPCGAPFRSDWGDEPGENPEWTTVGRSYGVNINIGTRAPTLSSFPYPAAIVIIGESRDCGYVANCGNYSGCPYARVTGGERHNNGANAIFVDGHAKWTKKDAYERPSIWDWNLPPGS
jgi:prepilin-type processing-associated H-X9-DG protein